MMEESSNSTSPSSSSSEKRSDGGEKLGESVGSQQKAASALASLASIDASESTSEAATSGSADSRYDQSRRGKRKALKLPATEQEELPKRKRTATHSEGSGDRDGALEAEEGTTTIAEARGVAVSTTPPTSTTDDEPVHNDGEDGDRKPAAVASSQPPSKGALKVGDASREEQARGGTTAGASTAGTVASARQDPEGVRIVKEIVAQRNQQEDAPMDGWFNWLDDLLEYYEKHGHCQVRDAENHILYSWLKRQRIMYRKGKLEPDKLRILQLLKTNGFDLPKTQEGADKPARGTRGAKDSAPENSGKQVEEEKQEEAKQAPQEAERRRHGLLPQASNSATSAPAPSATASATNTLLSLARNPIVQQPTALPGQDNLAATLLSHAIANQTLTMPGYSSLLSSLQANSAPLNPLQALPTSLAFATQRQLPPQDPPARVASDEASTTARAPLLAAASPAAISSLLASLPAGSASLVDAILGRQLSVPPLPQLNPQPQQPQPIDATQQALLLLLQQSQQRRQQQQQGQLLLEQLMLELQRRQRDDERPN